MLGGGAKKAYKEMMASKMDKLAAEVQNLAIQNGEECIYSGYSVCITLNCDHSPHHHSLIESVYMIHIYDQCICKEAAEGKVLNDPL